MSQGKRKYVISGPSLIRVVRMLAEGYSYPTIARETGIGKDNVGKIARRPEIRERVAKERQAIWDQAAGAAGRELAKSIRAMAEVRDDRAARQVDKLNAARAIVTTAKELREIADLEARIVELEATTREPEKSPSVDRADAEAGGVAERGRDAGGSLAE